MVSPKRKNADHIIYSFFNIKRHDCYLPRTGKLSGSFRQHNENDVSKRGKQGALNWIHLNTSNLHHSLTKRNWSILKVELNFSFICVFYRQKTSMFFLNSQLESRF